MVIEEVQKFLPGAERAELARRRAFTRHLGKRVFLYIYSLLPEPCRRRAWMDLAENLYDWSLGVYLQTFFADC